VGIICRKIRNSLSPEKLPLMGVLGAFVFAAQMVNFQLPLFPGTSGHMVGAVLLSIILGPAAAVIVMTSIVMVQCLIFQDGGLIAIGCNIINMAIVPCFAGYYLYKLINFLPLGRFKMQAASIFASIVAVELGAALVPLQASLSGVLVVPFKTFLLTMLGVHLIIGSIEGILTWAVLSFVAQAKPSLLSIDSASNRLSTRGIVVTFALAAMIAGSVLSLFASSLPDGLEWSYQGRPGPVIKNESASVGAADTIQQEFTLLPDYSKRTVPMGSSSFEPAASASAGWTSFAAIIGSALTMIVIYAVTIFARKKPALVSSEP
jgi:cobalt/nickel transport system permease protein